MADDVTVPGTGAVLAFDDIGGVLYARTKITLGADGATDGDVSSANPLPASSRAEKVDDAAFTPGTDRVLMIGAQLDDTSPDAVDEGDAGALRMSAVRSLHVEIRDAANNERGLNVDASGRIAVTVATLPASTNTIEVVGDAAHDAAAAGNPILNGALASAAEPTNVSADNDVTRLWADRKGRLITAQQCGTATRTQVSDSASDGVILAANTSRKGATIFNDSSATLYLGLGTTTASTTNYTVKVLQNQEYEVPFGFTGQIRGIWASDPGDGAARVTEFT